MVTPRPAFWSGKRVFLTGHTGFKGAWLECWLERLGAEVFTFSLPPATEPNLSVLMGSAAGPRCVFGDVNDEAALQKALTAAKPDIVLHLAAQALVRESYASPIETFRTNILGTLNVLKAATESQGVRAALIVTTDKCYENREWIWPYRENEALGGHDPYSASKACAEIATAAWRNSFADLAAARGRSDRMRIATARAGNVVGGGDWAADRLIPDFVRALTAGRELVIRRPNATRPWQHVLEPLLGYLLLAERLFDGEAEGAWNFGPDANDVRPVRWVVERLCEAWGDGARWRIDGGSHPHEAGLLALDASKARARLDWRPRLGLDDTVLWVCEWYKRQAAGEDARALTNEQIERYQSLQTRL